MFIHKGLCFPNMTLHKDKDILSYVSSLLYFQNMVHKDFKEKSIKAEYENPTGRDLGFIKIATPTPDFSCVKRDGLWVATFNPICTWTLQNKEEAEISLLIGILAISEDSYQQINKKLDLLFASKENIDQLLEAKTPFKISNILHEFFE